MQVDQIIASFGGLSALARALGHRNPSTVQGWRARKIIPAHQQWAVLEAARIRDLGIEPEDLIPREQAA